MNFLNWISYKNVDPTPTANCCICLSTQDGNLVAHKKVFAIRNNPPLHPIHKECIREAFRINDKACPVCREPTVPVCPLPMSLKEKLITVLKAGGAVGGVAAIAKLAQLLVTPVDFAVGVLGLCGGIVGYALSNSRQDTGRAFVGATAGAALATAGVLKYGTRTLIEQKQLIEKLGLFLVSGAGGVGAAIGLATTFKVINKLMPRVPRDPDEGPIVALLAADEGPTRGILSALSAICVATLVEKVVLKILTTLV